MTPDLILPASELYLMHTSTEKGHGVFAARPFIAGEVVEECPVIVLDAGFEGLPEQLQTRVFAWGVLADTHASDALALGFGSMYNHANPANLRYEANAAEELLRFVAVRDIAADEELTINYNARGGGHTCEDDNWFERMGVTRVAG